MSGFGRNKLNPASNVKWQAPPNPVDFESSLQELIASDPVRRDQMKAFFADKKELARKAGDANKMLSIEMLEMQYDFENKKGNIDSDFTSGFHKFLTGRLSAEDAQKLNLSNPAWARSPNYWKDEHQVSMMALPGVAGYVNALADERYMMEKKIMLMREFGPIQLNSRDRTPDVNSLWIYWKYALNKKGLDAIDFLDDWKFFHDLRFDTRNNKLYRYTTDNADYLDYEQRADILESHKSGIFAKETQANGDQTYTRRPIEVGIAQRITNPSAANYVPNKKAKAPAATKGKKAKKQKIKQEPNVTFKLEPLDPDEDLTNDDVPESTGFFRNLFSGLSFGFGKKGSTSKSAKEDSYNKSRDKFTNTAIDSVAKRHGFDISNPELDAAEWIKAARGNAMLQAKIRDAVNDYSVAGRIAEPGSADFAVINKSTKKRIGRARSNISKFKKVFDMTPVSSPSASGQVPLAPKDQKLKDTMLKQAGISDDQASPTAVSYKQHADEVDYSDDKAVLQLRQDIMLSNMKSHEKTELLKEVAEKSIANQKERDAAINAQAAAIDKSRKGKGKAKAPPPPDDDIEAAIKQLTSLDEEFGEDDSQASGATRPIDDDAIEKILEATGEDFDDYADDEIDFLAAQLDNTLDFIGKRNSDPPTVTDQSDLEKDLSIKRKSMPEQSKSPKKARPKVPSFKKPASKIPKLDIPENKMSDIKSSTPLSQFEGAEDAKDTTSISSAISVSSPRKGKSGRKKERGGLKTTKTKSASGEERQAVLGSPKTDLSGFLPPAKTPIPDADSPASSWTKFINQNPNAMTLEEVEAAKEHAQAMAKSAAKNKKATWGAIGIKASELAAKKRSGSTPNPMERETVQADDAQIQAELSRMADEGLRTGRSKSISGKPKRGSTGSVNSRGSTVSEAQAPAIAKAEGLIDKITENDLDAYNKAKRAINRLKISSKDKKDMLEDAGAKVRGEN